VQYGALPYRFTPHAALEILLVTTRQTRRWIIPKGWPIKGLRPAKSAAREAFEEAGVRGKISAKPLGLFTYEKSLDEAGVQAICEVRVFPLLVQEAKRGLARVRAADCPMGRAEQGGFAYQGAGPQEARRHVREARRRSGEQVHSLIGAPGRGQAGWPSPSSAIRLGINSPAASRTG
jgi:hypothetical protein